MADSPLGATKSATGCLLLILVAALVLVPISFSYIDYYNYGLTKRKSTGKVNSNKVYGRGRYFNGPDIEFLYYQADAHLVNLPDISVFSDGGDDSIGVSFQIDVDFTYFLQKENVGKLHRELSNSYQNVVLSRTNDAIKNSAITLTFREFFQNRKGVELQFREAVQARWNEDPPLHCTLDQFHLGRIRIPESVARKQLEARIQVERNDKEAFVQEARIEREKTKVEVNFIELQEEKLLQTSRAEASLLTNNAISQADQIEADALNNGTLTLLKSLGLTAQEDVIAFTYVRNLQKRENLDLAVSYLSDHNILKTTNLLR